MRGLTLAFLVGLFFVSAAHAQTRERVKVNNIRVGYVAGPNTSSGGRQVFKPGQWAPVFVDLECIRDSQEKMILTVETTDSDGVITEASVEIAAMVKGDSFGGAQLGPLPYLKPGSSYSTIAVRIKGAESKNTFGDSGTRNLNGLEVAPYVVASAGFNIGTLRLRTNDAIEDENNQQQRELRGGWVETAHILMVDQLPDQWIGYGPIDVLILGSGGDRNFWELLAQKQHAPRRRALVEWVRRGGRLIVSFGNNPDVLEAFKELRDVLPVAIPADAKQSSKSLLLNWSGLGQVSDKSPTLAYRENAGEFAWVKLQPRPGSFTLLDRIDEATNAKTPLVVQGAYGSGRITVVGFDLDRSPFVDWKNRASFWENLLNSSGYELPPIGAKYQRYGAGSVRDEHTVALHGNLNFFEGVPIVSFGWVALFILIYIVLIGPVDYLFLKKVVKRLEWTWVTFPIMVVVVSAGAYIAAYAIKGNDLKMNKIDIVDIDLAGKRMEGHTYFTLFSPRIDDYTVAVEPAGDDGDATSSKWTTTKSHDASYNSVLSWFGRVKDGYYSSSSGFFSKRFKYQTMTDPNEPDRLLFASGLERVPIQVWTTKTLEAEWTIGFDPKEPPIVANLAVSPADSNTLIGTLVNNLPVDDFSDVGLMWRGKIYELKDFTKGVTYNVTLTTAAGDNNAKAISDIKVWLNDYAARYKGASYTVPKPQGNNMYTDSGTPSNPNFRLWPILFYEATVENNRQGNDSLNAQNAAVRSLDQSWRVQRTRTEQAVLVLRTPIKEDRAEAMTKSPASPSRLWLGKFPNEAEKRPELQGTLRQETYVRIFIPVKPASR